MTNKKVTRARLIELGLLVPDELVSRSIDVIDDEVLTAELHKLRVALDKFEESTGIKVSLDGLEVSNANNK